MAAKKKKSNQGSKRSSKKAGTKTVKKARRTIDTGNNFSRASSAEDTISYIARAYLELVESHPDFAGLAPEDRTVGGGVICRALCAIAYRACKLRGGSNCEADYRNCRDGCK